ncbi:MAG: glycosyltransferase family 4 protein [Actinobacteria bacterium]|nr:glycosyltransferase family 4 protein [Actinomycetota bacterium]
MGGPIRVALDATPLFGSRTGVGAFTLGLLQALAARDDVKASGYALSWRAFRSLAAALPEGVRPILRPMPPQPLRACWLRWDGVVVPEPIPPVAEASPDDGRRLAGADRYVLSLSTIEPRKDHPSLVRAFDRVGDAHPDVRLVIAGMDGWGTAPLDQALSASRHRNRIVRLGYVGDGDRAALLRGASVLAFPSRYEGFGLPPLEAMSVDVPVVATTAGSLPEILGRDAALLVPPGDDAALAEGVGAILEDSALRARLIAAGARRAAGYTPERCANGMVALYARAASEN